MEATLFMARVEQCLLHRGSNPKPINSKPTDIPASGPIIGLFLLTMRGAAKEIILNGITLSCESHSARNFQPLAPLGMQSIQDILVAVVWRLKIFLPQRCLSPFSSPCQPSHPLNISLWSILQCITCCLWPNTFLALLYDTGPTSSSSDTFSDCALPNLYFFGLVGWRELSAAFVIIIIVILVLLFIQRCFLLHILE